MRRAVAFLAALLMTGVSLAQRAPSVPIAAVSENKKLNQETKIRYLLRQLELTVEQRRHARGLFATILDDTVNPPLSIDDVHAIVAEIQEAKKQGDKELVQQLEEQLRELGRGYDREAEFFMNMETVLTDEQKALLQEARARLESNPSGSLRPVDVFRAARRLDLTKEQHARLDELHKMFREKLRRTKKLDDDARFQLINGLLELVKAELTPAQQPSFELSIRRQRPDLAYRLRVRLPDTQPARPAEPGEEEDQPTGD